jgi:hypothetical protein
VSHDGLGFSDYDWDGFSQLGNYERNRESSPPFKGPNKSLGVQTGKFGTSLEVFSGETLHHHLHSNMLATDFAA